MEGKTFFAMPIQAIVWPF